MDYVNRSYRKNNKYQDENIVKVNDEITQAGENRDFSKEKIVKLRAYHPTYMVCFFGNQNIASEDHNKNGFSYVYEILKKEPNTIVELVKEFDDICTQCKKLEKDDEGSVWGTNMSCTSSRDEEVVREVHTSSIKVLEALGLSYGSRISWRKLVKLLSERIPHLNDPMIGGPGNQGNYEAGFKVLGIQMGTQKTN